MVDAAAMTQTTFTLTEVLTLLVPVIAGIVAHFTATAVTNGRITRLSDRLKDELHRLELKSLNASTFKDDLKAMEGRLEENFKQTIQLAITENNTHFEEKLISTMKSIMQDKISSLQRTKS